MTRNGKSPGRRMPTGLGATPSGVTMRAANDLDQWYRQNGCTACDDMGSDLRVRTLAFKCAVLLDPATSGSVALNYSTPLAQSGFGPGTDAALTLVLGASRLSKGHCTDDDGHCIVGASQTPQIPLELQAVANSLGASLGALIQQGQNVPQTDATITMLMQQAVAMFKSFCDQLKAVLNQVEKPLPPPNVPQPGLPPQNNAPPPLAMAKPVSSTGLVLGIVGIALVAVGTGAVIMTATQRRKAKKK